MPASTGTPLNACVYFNMILFSQIMQVMKDKKYILVVTTSVTNRQGSRQEGILLLLILNFWNGLLQEFTKSMNRQIFGLLIPCIKSVDSLFHTCISPVPHLYIEWLCMFKVDIVNEVSSIFEKINDRRMAVPWYTGLSPPRLEDISTDTTVFVIFINYKY